LQQARDDEMREAYRDDLIACPDFIAELALEDEEAERAAAAVTDADMAEVGRIVTTALYRAADELIATRADESGITPGEAAGRRYWVDRREPARGAAGTPTTPPTACRDGPSRNKSSSSLWTRRQSSEPAPPSSATGSARTGRTPSEREVPHDRLQGN